MRKHDALAALAGSLRELHLPADFPEPALMMYCHLLPSRDYRVTRYLRNRVCVLGLSPDRRVAALFSDCMTDRLWEYYAEPALGDISRFNYREMYSSLAESQPIFREHANNVMRYLREHGHLRDIEQLRAARGIAMKIRSDAAAAIDLAQANYCKVSASLANLYKL